jgi:hypothetical protein
MDGFGVYQHHNVIKLDVPEDDSEPRLLD